MNMELEVAGLGKEELKPVVSEAGGTVKAAGSSPLASRSGGACRTEISENKPSNKSHSFLRHQTRAQLSRRTARLHNTTEEGR
jgi:hypothetical protein